ncbi:olfactory receptor 4D11-like [Engraulis encrasicolus]|uniref:olfactory receptor 4D11-like n=1 Tax=Engraulis encrasicolus TaxID=184585 RepID=UPI002FD6D375
MSNVTFILDAYRQIHNERYIFAAVLALLYPVMIFGNLLIIYVVSVERRLHEPMYILIGNLACINLYGGSSLAPFIVSNILSGTFQISRAACFIQIFSINTYGGSSLHICGNVIEKVYCDNYSLLKLACPDPVPSRFDMSHVPYAARVVLSLYFLIVAPVLNPVVYGARTEKIKEAIQIHNCFMKKKRTDR